MNSNTTFTEVLSLLNNSELPDFREMGSIIEKELEAKAVLLEFEVKRADNYIQRLENTVNVISSIVPLKNIPKDSIKLTNIIKDGFDFVRRETNPEAC